MKSILQTVLLVSALVPVLSQAQGFMYDQQSSDESNGGVGGYFIQNAQPTGQSFTPSLSGIGFVRFNLFDQNRNNGMGATVYVNLRMDSITGSIIDSTAPVALPDNLTPGSFINFFFNGNVPLQPGVKYYLQPVVQSGDLFGVIGDSFNYSGGDLYYQGNSTTSSDLWFREGVIVPEPSVTALLFIGTGMFYWLKGRKTPVS